MQRTSVIRALALLALVSLVACQNCQVSNDYKADCGVSGSTQSTCEASGCCWQELYDGSAVPWCYYPNGTFTAPPPPPPGVPFTNSNMQTMWGFFLANLDIEGLGGVVAAPDNDTPGGSYIYHWERDGALSMDAYLLTSGPNMNTTHFNHYVQWVLNVQNEPDPNGIDVRVEPKYYLPNGEVYDQSWCRPQTDGPALRAITLINYANYLIENGQKDYVQQYLWTGSSSYNGGAIKFDLDWVVNGWQQNSCDLWEEVQSTDFFWNRSMFKKAMFLGSDFAAAMGDSSSSSSYHSAGSTINSTLEAHYNGDFIFESTNREEDSAVILALNNGYDEDEMFSPMDPRVTQTIDTYNMLFYTTYSINLEDSENGVPGILYGRYQGDTYAGGNPWILTTNSLAQLFYRGATTSLVTGELPDSDTMKHWRNIFWHVSRREHSVESLLSMSPFEFAAEVATAGDAVLDRVYYHVEPYGFHLSEQIDRNTGAESSATDLTWSYATVLKAVWYRNYFTNEAMKAMPELAHHPDWANFFKKLEWN